MAKSGTSASYRAASSDTSWEDMSIQEKVEVMCAAGGKTEGRFYSQFLGEDLFKIRVPKPTPGSIKGEFWFRVSPFYCNFFDSLHGGAQSTIFDILTSVLSQAAGSAPFQIGSVSRTLNVSYLRPAPEGSVVICEVEVTQSGKTLALLRGAMRRESDGALISTCEHHKAAVAPPASKL